MTSPNIHLLISFRGKKIEMPLLPTTTSFHIKSHLSRIMEGDLNISPSEIKLIHKGKVISCFDDETDSGSAISSLYDSLTKGLSKKKHHSKRTRKL